MTLFDGVTAAAPPSGRGAKSSRDYPRDSFPLATKALPDVGRDRGLSREQVHKQIDGSLERLRLDHVDLYQCHRYDDADAAGGDDAGADRGRARRARRAASASASGRQRRIEEALALPGVAKFVSSQPQYSALWRRPRPR